MGNHYKITMLLFMLSFHLWGCNEFVPSAKYANNFPEFVIEPAEIRGIYANADIPSFIFEYKTLALNPLAKIKERAYGGDWQLIRESTSELEFVRNNPPPPPPAMPLWGYEWVRVTYVEASGRLCFGWLGISSHEKLQNPEDDPEGRWGINHFWPKYEQCKEK